ncbi:MAG TPA: protein kinase, partial [Terriglobia bacterium]|nr:protein kinase [Terriglobia bacterium]
DAGVPSTQPGTLIEKLATQRVQRVNHSTLEREEKHRDAFLKEACAGDEVLRREVESLLAHKSQAEDFTEVPALEAAAKGLAAGQPQSWVGEVAVKVMPSAFSADGNRLRRFEQEARAAGRLNHPDILAIYDVRTCDASPYIVSELLEGGTLRDQLGGSALPQRKAIDYALQIARGLAAAHEKGIIHRDLKPENLFVTNDGRVKILDFGLAKLTHPVLNSSDVTDASTELRPTATAPGVLMGTAGYISPEQVRFQSASNIAFDLEDLIGPSSVAEHPTPTVRLKRRDFFAGTRRFSFPHGGSHWRLVVPGESTPARLPFVGGDGLMPVVSRPSPGSRLNRVISRTSVMRYKGSPKSLPEICRRTEGGCGDRRHGATVRRARASDGEVNSGGDRLACVGARLRTGSDFLQGVVQTNAGRAFPFGTLAVNVSGCFILGLLNGPFTPFSDRSAVADLFHHRILRRLYHLLHAGFRNSPARQRPRAFSGSH